MAHKAGPGRDQRLRLCRPADLLLCARNAPALRAPHRCRAKRPSREPSAERARGRAELGPEDDADGEVDGGGDGDGEGEVADGGDGGGGSGGGRADTAAGGIVAVDNEAEDSQSTRAEGRLGRGVSAAASAATDSDGSTLSAGALSVSRGRTRRVSA